MSTRQRPKALLIAGPTASGKSAYAIVVARSRHGVIINADSMQVYREFRVLTARPSPAQEARDPHRLYGHVSVKDPYSVGQWLTDAAGAIAAAHAADQLPIIIGGTGLYFRALLEGLAPVPSIPHDIRSRWRNAGESWPAEDLYAELQRMDPMTAANLRPSDPQRLVRALEVMEATGKPLAEWQKIKGTPVLADHEVAKVVISRDREVLYDRSARRFELMLEEGALAEAALVGRLGLDPGLPASRVLGLSPLKRFLSGEMSRQEAIETAQRDTRRYIKRQLTWQNRYMISWKHIDPQQMKTPAI
ncbi:MAG: tRNA (adenosine(37)-N6)-dimethylallyltransferase MiaA [Hyphomicrobiaceae bacterium]|nr:tRNA (adenosine(37)-N6)-dimethylallyltransferase MiaA [Hyphomicrobiaceae bacterium]MCC0010086.1 tRNA (adenosine(37)-N6)-dimethylallyltransferase MiaA [Hyphomicrobiaceae bacterium]